MIAEAIGRIEDLVKKANGLQIVHVPGEPAHLYWAALGNEMKRVHANPAPRNHKVHDIKSLADMVLRFAGKHAYSEGEPNETLSVSIWYSREGIVALLDDDDRRDRITHPIKLSAAMKRLLAWEANQKAHTPQEIRKIFRSEFPNT